MSRQWAAACAAITVCMVVPTGAGYALSLKEALAATYLTNPQLDAQRASLRATDEEVAKANSRFRPSLSITGSGGVQNLVTEKPAFTDIDRTQTSGAITLSEPLYRGGRTVAELRRARALVRAGRAVLTGTEQNVLLEAVTAYMDVARDEQIVALRREHVETLEQQLVATTQQLGVGAVTQTDVSQTETRLQSARAGFSVAEGQLGASRARFERAIGIPAESVDLAPVIPALPVNLDDAVGVALGNAPALIAARENAVAANFAIDGAIGALLPQVSLQLQYQYAQNATVFGVVNPNVTQRGASAFVQLTVPLYAGEANALVRQARQQYSQSLYNISDMERQIRQAIFANWNLYLSAQRAIAATEAQVAASGIALEGVIQEQRAGQRSVLEILNAQLESFNARIELAGARHNATVIAYQLILATGGLTARALDLDVKFYDPDEHLGRAAAAWFSLGTLE
jgi:outer membrane protein